MDAGAEGKARQGKARQGKKKEDEGQVGQVWLD